MATLPTAILHSTRTTEGAFDELFRLYLTIALVVGFAVIGWLLLSLARFRARRRDEPTEKTLASGAHPHRGHPVVFGVMALGISGILFATMLGTMGTVDEFHHPPEGESIDVGVVGFRYGWIFQYPQGFETLNELVVPVDHVIKLGVTSQDVMHKFQLRSFRIGVDAMPGRTNRIWFQPTSLGTFDAWCAELCGVGHSVMRAKIKVVPLNEFEEWTQTHMGGEAEGALTQVVEVSMNDTAVTPPRIDALAGIRLKLHVRNTGTANHTFVVDAPANVSTPALQPGAFAWVNATVADGWLAADGGENRIDYGSIDFREREAGVRGQLVVRAPRTIPVELGEWAIKLGNASVALNETVRFRVTNAGSAPHDFTLGTWSGEEAARRIRWRLPLLQPGETADMLVRPDSTGRWDVWCEVPGHAQLGMRTHLEVVPS